MKSANEKTLSATDAFHVPFDQHLLESLVHGCPKLWVRLGNLETKLLSHEIADISVDRPIFLGGLARSGSTILLEILAAQQDVGTHQYRDFSGLFTPLWWDQIQQRVPSASSAPVERAHGDGLMITPESPEALEEAIWMAFFPQLHDSGASQVLDAKTANSKFEQFYDSHLRKLLRVRGRERYASKGNYNISRIGYLRRLYHDARFVIPIRQPLNHIASLVKQHSLFTVGESRNPRALTHMRRIGHFEFGLDRRPIHVGDQQAIDSVLELWSQGEEVRGWARYWAMLYGWVADQLDTDPGLRDSSLVIRFEDLCDDPASVLQTLFAHCQLDGDDVVEKLAPTIHAPTYYRPKFSPEETAAITEETADVAKRFGYDDKANVRTDPVIADTVLCGASG